MARCPRCEQLFSLAYYRKHDTNKCEKQTLRLKRVADHYACEYCAEKFESRIEILEHSLKRHPEGMAYRGISRERLQEEILKAEK